MPISGCVMPIPCPAAARLALPRAAAQGRGMLACGGLMPARAGASLGGMILSPFDRRPRIALVRLSGAIAARPGFGGGISLATTGPVLDRAFGLKRLSAVFLVINSPGGSPVQS